MERGRGVSCRGYKTFRAVKHAVVYACLVVLVAFAGCADSEREDGEQPLRVVATTSLIADLARELGGEHVAVEGLMGPGVDPHLYRASEGDVSRMTEADLILYNGMHLEGKMVDILGRLGERTYAVTSAIPEGSLLAPPEFEGNYDPHLWMDVGLWRQVVGATAEALAGRDPAHADAYRARAADYAARLDSLDRWVHDRLSVVPEEQRALVTAHDAFNYFGRAYRFEVRGLQGISTATEAGTADVQGLADFVSERRIPAMFVESSVSPRNIEAVREAVRARDYEVVIGGSLFSDALGGVGSGADSYEGMIRHNISTIAEALAPATEPGS